MNSFDRKEWLKYLSDKNKTIEPGFIFQQSGILNVNKPPGISSMDVLRVIKKNGQVPKAGHGGTLDPMASGVLPVLLNKATKLSDEYLGSEKSYDGTFLLGQATDTQDITGKPVGEKVSVPDLSVEQIQEAAQPFIGEIIQIPPVFSALKKGGRPLYEYARKGKEVLVEGRNVEVLDFRILEKLANDTFSFFVHCKKGVYVRTLVHDLGAILGTGGTLASLRRVSVGPLTIDNAVDLDKLKSADDIQKHLIMPPD